MLPRSAKDQEDHYVCRTHKQTGGAEACKMPPLKRSAVDGAFYEIFSQTGIDIEATRQRIAQHLDTQVREITEQAARAEREVKDPQEQDARVDRDHRSGGLPLADYTRLRDQIAAEQVGAEAEALRLREHANAVIESAEHIDAESETLRALAELQAQIADGTAKGEAKGIQALRAAIATVLDVVFVSPGNPSYKYPFDLEPELREELLESMPKGALALPVPENNSSGSGLPRALFGRVPIRG
jgi:hypothetical protein